MAEIIVNIPFSEYMKKYKIKTPEGIKLTTVKCYEGFCPAYFESACLGVEPNGTGLLRLYNDHRLMDPVEDAQPHIVRLRDLYNKLIQENCILTNDTVRK